MAKLVFDNVGDRLFETGVKNGVLFVMGDNGNYEKGVVWNGLTGVTEKPTGAEPTNLYADDIKYLILYGAEEFEATIEAYTYPKEFEECDGSAELMAGVNVGQQPRKSFAFCYTTALGNDTKAQNFGYKIHIIYGCTAKPSEKAYTTINDTPEAVTFSWDVTTVPVSVTGMKPTSTLVVDSSRVKPDKLKALEDVLYGSELEESHLPLPDEVKALLSE